MQAESACAASRSPWKCSAAKAHILQCRMCSICAALLPVLAMGPTPTPLLGRPRLLKAPVNTPESILRLSLRSCSIGGLMVCRALLALLVQLLVLGNAIDPTAAVRSGWTSPLLRGTNRSRRASLLLPGASLSSWARLFRTATRAEGAAAQRVATLRRAARSTADAGSCWCSLVERWRSALVYAAACRPALLGWRYLLQLAPPVRNKRKTERHCPLTWDAIDSAGRMAHCSCMKHPSGNASLKRSRPAMMLVPLHDYLTQGLSSWGLAHPTHLGTHQLQCSAEPALATARPHQVHKQHTCNPNCHPVAETTWGHWPCDDVHDVQP